MDYTKVAIWSMGFPDEVLINNTGHIDKAAITAFTQGQCHAFAWELHMLTQWPLVAACDPNWDEDPNILDDKNRNPTHVLCQSPQYGLVDIHGAEVRIPFIYSIKPLADPENIFKWTGYHQPPALEAAVPFAHTIYNRYVKKYGKGAL